MGRTPNITFEADAVTRLRRLLLMLCLCGVSAHGYAHEMENVAGPTAAMHAIYHEVASSSYPRVDVLVIKISPSDKPWVFSHYFDPATNSLYSCIGEDDSIICNGPERAKKITWSKTESMYGRHNNLLPTDRVSQGPVYFLEGANPFSQLTTYVYFTGHGKVIRCRKTFTEYNFAVDRNGERLFFQGKKKNDFTEQCEQIYPLP